MQRKVYYDIQILLLIQKILRISALGIRFNKRILNALASINLQFVFLLVHHKLEKEKIFSFILENLKNIR